MFVFLIFASVLFLILLRPKNLQIWLPTIIGTLICLALGYVSAQDLNLIFWLVWDSSLTLIGLIILSLSLEKLGFFGHLSFIILKVCNQSSYNGFYIIETRKLLFFMFICALIFSAILANDGAILILTPLVLDIIRRLDSKNLSFGILFLFAISFLCDSGSNAFVISNLTNIITAKYFNLSFLDFALAMFLPNILAAFTFIFLFFIIFNKKLPKILRFNENLCVKKPQILKNSQFYLYVFLIVLFNTSLFIADYINLPNSLPCLFFAILLMILAGVKNKKNFKTILFSAPFSIIIFSFGLFVIVLALFNEILCQNLNIFYELLRLDSEKSSNISVALMASISAIGANIFNNLPMVLIGNLALGDFFVKLDSENLANFKNTLIYAHLLGCNISAKLTPIGSLCTILWLGILSKNGISINLKTYFSLSIIFTLCSLFVAVLVLILPRF